MPSFAIESALYKLRKKNGLRADERDFPENYVNGKSEGVAKVFYPNGKVKYETPYKNDKKEGEEEKMKSMIQTRE